MIKNLIEVDSFGEVFGEPGCGKSFWAIELSCCVATGKDFFGFEVKRPGPVFYLAGEGRGGLVRRFAAWKIARGASLAGVPLYVNETPLVLIDEASCLHAAAALQKMMSALQTPPSLIVIDTWSRNLGGDDSSPQDAAIGVAALDQIRSRLENVACIVVHHCGQAAKDRSRGWSGLRAAVDAEYRMERGTDELIRLTCTKNKEGAAPDPMAFQMASINLGINDEDGNPVYSAVLSETDYVDDPGASRPPPGKNQALALDILEKLLADNPFGVAIKEWRDRCVGAGLHRTRFYDIKKGFERRGKIKQEGGYVSLA